MKQLKHWQDPVNAVLGLFLAISPWLVGYQEQVLATWSAVIAGLVLCAVGLGAVFVPRAWEEWTETGLGVWMIVSPWALGFSNHILATQTALWTGIVVVVLALWTLMTDKDYSGWWRPVQ